MSALVELRDLFRVYPSAEGGVAALQGLTLTVQRGRALRRARAERLGQVDAAADRRRLRQALGGLGAASPASTSPALGAWEAGRLPLARDRLRRPALLAGARGRADGARARRRAARARRRGRERRATRARTSCSSASAWAHARDAHPRELSGGEQQRVALCAALARRPQLLIADEPTGELDAATAREVLDLIAELSREEGGTALVVSHDPASAERADRVVHVRDGRISDERVAGGADGAIVVGRGGWLRLPEELLRSAGIDRHAHGAPARRRARRRAGRGLSVPATQAPLAARSTKPFRAELVLIRTQAIEARGADEAVRVGDAVRAARRDVRAREAHRRHRAVGLRQDDAAAPARRARGPGRGRGARRRGRRCARSTAPGAPSCGGVRSPSSVRRSGSSPSSARGRTPSSGSSCAASTASRRAERGARRGRASRSTPSGPSPSSRRASASEPRSRALSPRGRW